MNPKSQKERVLAMLRYHGKYGVRSDRFLQVCIPRAAARIWELREAGYEITAEREKQFVRYRLAGHRAGGRGEPGEPSGSAIGRAANATPSSVSSEAKLAGLSASVTTGNHLPGGGAGAESSEARLTGIGAEARQPQGVGLPVLTTREHQPASADPSEVPPAGENGSACLPAGEPARNSAGVGADETAREANSGTGPPGSGTPRPSGQVADLASKSAAVSADPGGDSGGKSRARQTRVLPDSRPPEPARLFDPAEARERPLNPMVDAEAA